MSNVVEDDAKELTEEQAPTVTPGQKLQRARRNRNLEQSDIAKELKLDLRFVQALEEGRFKDLPQPVYTAGYVRAYSKLVGLKPDDIVSEYLEQQKASVKTGSKKKEKEHIPSHYRHVQTDLPKSFSVGHSQSSDKRKFNILISVLAVVVVFAIVWQVSNRSSESTPSAVPADSNVSPPANGAPAGQEKESSPAENSGADGTTEQKTIDLPLPKLDPQSLGDNLQKSSEQTAEPANVVTEEAGIAKELVDNAEKLTELSIRYNKNSWVDIRDATGKAIIRKLGLAGDSSTVSGIAPFEVLLGYSPGVSIELDGKPFDMSPYSKQRVVRFVMDESSAQSGSSIKEKKQASKNKKKQDDQDSERTLPEDF